ncbi:MAG: redoxin domain-containing protein [Alphaproteobacteria bacterium]|jgi:glutathione peroxidase|nr:redoxin domain-containing protein [Alphaproteobacteria bacterium]
MRWIAALVVALGLAAPAAADVGDVRFAGIAGGEIALGDYAGRPVLVVNTASFCGFTDQYAGLQDLWERYRDDGLVVVGVPTDDFDQEPGTAAEIKEFCEVEFDVDFPLTAKVTTRGADRHPFFAEVARSLGEAALPGWNFHKFLVGADGELEASWPSHVRPESAAITETIEAELAGEAASS